MFSTHAPLSSQQGILKLLRKSSESKKTQTMKINILGKEKGIRNKFQGSHVGGVGIFNTKVISTDLF